jgi:IS5 family transposase
MEPCRCRNGPPFPVFAMRHFAGIELGDDRIPDERTILNFSHLLERHGLTQAIFADVNAHLADKGITLRSGTLVDATIIDAPSSTKNKAGEREAAFKSPGKVWGVMRKAPKGSPLHPLDERINRIIARVRAKVEHPFRIIKRQFGHVKTRYCGLAKNRAQQLVPSATEAHGMRTSLSKNWETAPRRAGNRDIRPQMLISQRQKRSGCHQDPAEAADQTFLYFLSRRDCFSTLLRCFSPPEPSLH